MSCNHPLNRSITYFGPRSIDFREKIQIFPKIFDSFENFGLRIFWSKNTSWSQTASNHLKTPKIGFLRKFFCPPPMSRVWPQKIGRPPPEFFVKFLMGSCLVHTPSRSDLPFLQGSRSKFGGSEDSLYVSPKAFTGDSSI